LIATPLVEAGVDIDFPVVWRAMAGLDSIVQAGGRCNREGRQAMGHVFVYRAPSAPPPGTPRKALEVTESMLVENNSELDLADPQVFDTYFRRLYITEELDRHRIQTLRQELRFASVARKFRIIDDEWTEPIVVRFGDSAQRIEQIRMAGPSRAALRRLQRFIVQLPRRDHERLLSVGALEEIAPGIFALTPDYSYLYDRTYGLAADRLSSGPVSALHPSQRSSNAG
jgi:CRISPR-associated endonuclease/helicase Cas3